MSMRRSEHDPDSTLMAVLERPPDPGEGNAGRVERIGAFEHIINRLLTLQEAEIAAYVTDAEAAMEAMLTAHDRGSGPPGIFDTLGHAGRAAAAEIQLVLHLTGAGMLTRLERARLLHDDPRMAPTATLARTGRLTVPKIKKILDGTSGLTPEQIGGLQQAVLPKAPTQTSGQLGAAIQRFLVGLEDREVPVRRRDRATRSRAVVVQAEPDGMAPLRVFLPAAAATGIYAVLDEHARQCPRTDVRTMDQRRTDALTDLVLHGTGRVSEGTAAATAAGAEGPRGAARTGSSTTGTNRVGTAGMRTGRAGTGRGTGTANTGQSTGAGAAGTETDGVDADGVDIRTDGDRIRTGALAVPGVAPAPPGGSPFTRNTVSVRINVTVPADSLLGVGDAGDTAELSGYGPIPITDARALAFLPGSVWYRLLTDPPTGRIVERGTTAYRPGAALTELVRAEHTTCVHPGCRMPADRCDLDHVVPFHAESGAGPTDAGNLRPLCRSHHRLKHTPGWTVVLRTDGGVEWTTPSGHVHVAEPTPVGPVRAIGTPTHRGPGVLELMRDPGLAARLATNTAEAPF